MSLGFWATFHTARCLAGKAKPEVQYFYDQCRLMITDFMNDGAARGVEVYVNNKGGNRNWPDGVGCLEKDNLKLKVIGPKWESCTTFGTSFGYLEGDRYKSIESILHEMIEVISRNGNFLVNIGPKPDGTIPEPQMERLMAMKRWLKINGDAIYGSRYWKESEQRDEHLAFTTNGKKLYAIKLTRPEAPFVITGTAGWNAEKVKSVRLLGLSADVSSQMTQQGLKIMPPADLGESDYAWSFEIVTDETQHHPNVIVRNSDKALKGTKAVDLEGRVNARNGSGTSGDVAGYRGNVSGSRWWQREKSRPARKRHHQLHDWSIDRSSTRCPLLAHRRQPSGYDRSASTGRLQNACSTRPNRTVQHQR